MKFGGVIIFDGWINNYKLVISLIIIALYPNSRDGFWTELDFKLWERIYWRHSKSKSGQGGNVGNRDESLGGSRKKKNYTSKFSILQYSRRLRD